MKTDQVIPSFIQSCGKRFASLAAVAVAALTLPFAGQAAGTATQFIWSTPPGGTTSGSPFSQQPTLIAADADGNPSTIGLPASVPVTVDTVPPGNLVGGAISFDMGTGPGASNGVAIFHGVQIDNLGGYFLRAVAGNGTNAVSSPTNGIANCKLWLDASDLATLTLNSNNNVSAWADKSGTGNNATNANVNGVANAPLTNINVNLPASAAGGGRVLTLNGTNRLNINLTYITNSTYSIIAMTQLNPAVTANNDYFMGTPFSGNGTDLALHVGYRNATQYTFAQYADDLNVTFPSAQVPAGPVLGSHIHPAGTRRVYLNGLFAGNNNMADLRTGIVQANIGRGNGGNFRGDIAEVIVYNTNLTELQRIGVENYMANKWLGQFNAGATTAPFFVGNGVPVAGLSFVQQPTDTVAGGTVTPSVTVLVTNASGTGIAGLPVTLSVLSGTGALNGTAVQTTDGSGVATYGDLGFNVAGTKQLQATILVAATNSSNPFLIYAGAATQIAIRTQPSTTATAGTAFARQPVVSFEDVLGNVVSNLTDNIIASQNFGGTLSQTADNSVTVAAVAGTATFTGLNITNTGVNNVQFSSGVFPAVLSGNVTVSANIPNILTIQQPPSSSAQVGVVFDYQPLIGVQDVYGNPVNGTVVSASDSAGFLFGTTTVTTATVNGYPGLANYVGLYLTNLGDSFLTFKAGTGTNVVSIDSPTITVTPGPASQVIWVTQPGSGVAGSPLSTQPSLRTADSGGNITTVGLGATNLVVVSQLAGSGLVGAPLTYNIGTDGSNGVISFSGLQINNPATSNVLAADYIGNMIAPTSSVPNCILWLDASDLSTLTTTTTNAQLVQWTDKSGTHNNAVNSNGFPLTNLNISLPVTSYGGQHVAQFFSTNLLWVDLTSLNSSAYTFLAMETATSAGATVGGSTYFLGSDFVNGGNNGTDHALHVGYQAANQFRIGHYADDLTYTASGNWTLQTPRLWSGQFDGASKFLFLNGNQVATAGSAPLTLITNGAVGRGNGSYYRGDMSELLVFNRALDATERGSIEQYLLHKWVQKSRSLSSPFVVASLVPVVTVGATTTTVTISVTGAPGRTYRLLASTDLSLPTQSWSLLGSHTFGQADVWTVVEPNNQAGRFYKAVTP